MHISNKTVNSSMSSININKVANKALNNVNNYDVQNYEEIDYNSTKEIDVFSYNNISYDEFMPQGFTSNDKYYFIGAYDKDAKKNSRIYIYDKITGKYLFYIETNNKSHMGGVSFDKNNNILFITNGTKDIKALNWEKMEDYINKNLDFIIYGNNNISLSTVEKWMEESKNYNEPLFINTKNINMDKLRSSYSYFDGKYLYIGNFATASDPESHRILKKYKLDYDKTNNSLNIVSESTLPTPIGVQGVATYNKDGNEYIVFACSIFGSAILDTYKINKDGSLTQISTYDLTKHNKNGVEGIEIDENGNLHAIFEFADFTYGKYAPTVYESFTISMDKLLKNNIFKKPSLLNRAQRLIANSFYDDNPLVDEDDYGKTGAKYIAGSINTIEALHEAANNKDHNILERGAAKTGEFVFNIVALPAAVKLFFDTALEQDSNEILDGIVTKLPGVAIKKQWKPGKVINSPTLKELKGVKNINTINELNNISVENIQIGSN